MQACILVQTNPMRGEKVAEAISNYPGVVRRRVTKPDGSVVDLVGAYAQLGDQSVHVYADVKDGLALADLVGKIATTPNVVDTQTLPEM